MDEKTSKKTARSPKKRTYRKPTLVVYGDLGRITKNDPAGGGAFDGTFIPPDNFFKTS